MIYSLDRIAYLARTIVSETKNGNHVNYNDESGAYAEIKRLIENYLKVYDEVYNIIAGKLSKNIRIKEGTNEYNVLFKKFLEEELNKRGIYE
jgi:hypothetical protein